MVRSKPIWRAIKHLLRAANLMFAFAMLGAAIFHQQFMGGRSYGEIIGLIGGALFGLFAYRYLVL